MQFLDGKPLWVLVPMLPAAPELLLSLIAGRLAAKFGLASIPSLCFSHIPSLAGW